MDKKIIIAFLLCFISTISFCQIKNIDSLEKILVEVENGNKKISTQEKFEIVLKLSGLYTENAPEKAEKYLEKSMILAKKLKDKTNIGFVYQQKALYHEKLGEFEEGLENIKESLQFADNTYNGQKLNIFALLAKGSILRRMSKYEDAYQSFLEANKIAEASKNDTLLYSTYAQLGIISVTLKDNERAIQYHTKAIEIAKRLKSNRKISKSYGNLGIICRENENYTDGIEYNKKAMEYALKSGDSSSISYAMAELGTMYNRAGEYKKATPILLEAIAIRERNHEQNELAYTYFYIASNMSNLGKINESENWMRKALAQAKNINNVKQVIDCYQMMGIIFEKNKKSDSSLKYFKTYIGMRDSLSGISVKEKIEELNIKYETQKKDLKIKDQKLKNTYLFASIALLLLGMGILLSAFQRRKLKHKNELQNTMIQEQNKATKAIIEAEENERQRIASDLHDGVGQYMTAAKMSLESLVDKANFNNDIDNITFENAIKLVSNSVSDVRTISHNMMPNALLKNGLGKAVRSFLDSINQQKLKVQLFTDGLQIPIESNTEIFLYRIIQECVNNVLKHANASELNISILVNKIEIDVTIEDNGKGFDINSLSEKAGIGIENMQKRILFLKGDIHWDSAIGKGTTVVMNVPMDKS